MAGVLWASVDRGTKHFPPKYVVRVRGCPTMFPRVCDHPVLSIFLPMGFVGTEVACKMSTKHSFCSGRCTAFQDSWPRHSPRTRLRSSCTGPQMMFPMLSIWMRPLTITRSPWSCLWHSTRQCTRLYGAEDRHLLLHLDDPPRKAKVYCSPSMQLSHAASFSVCVVCHSHQGFFGGIHMFLVVGAQPPCKIASSCPRPPAPSC